ncbi:hypothetical protein JL722_10651 [Aureococcus anophagefferens]|nr:hypothetical protein JL722_10651 [Aureococcus anophagefferens]
MQRRTALLLAALSVASSIEAPRSRTTALRAAAAPKTNSLPAVAAGGALDAGLAKRLEVGAVFALWYALNVYYNVLNKKVLKVVKLPWLRAVNAGVNGEVLPLGVYASLLPVIGGVGGAVATDLSFNPLSFAGRWRRTSASFAVCSKNAMRAPGSVLAALGAPSLFGVVTLGALLLVAPVARLEPGPLAAAGVASPGLAASLACSGLFHYLNNEVMYLALARPPVTLAVGNTLCVVVILAALVVFQEPMNLATAVGTAVAIAGVLLARPAALRRGNGARKTGLEDRRRDPVESSSSASAGW